MTESAQTPNAQGRLVTAADILDEGTRLTTLSEATGLTLRLLGGVAVRHQCPSASQPPLARIYGDLDFAAPRRSGRLVTQVFEAAGYEADRRFNAMHGDKRLIFVDATRERKIDVFLGVFQMCHVLELDDRLGLEQVTLPIADLVLTKMQIVELNTKDALDALALFIDHPVASSRDHREIAAHAQGAPIDGDYIAALCGSDWGWFTTVTDNLYKITSIGIDTLAPTAFETVSTRIRELRALIEAAPKSMKWKLRARVGKRVQWYEEPEEVRR